MPPALTRVEEASVLLIEASDMLRADPYSAAARKKLIEGSRGIISCQITATFHCILQARFWLAKQQLVGSLTSLSAQIRLYQRWSLCGMCSFHFCRWNQFKVILLACTLCTRNRTSNFPRRRTPVDDIRHITLTQAVTIDYESRDMSVMTEDWDVELCKSFNLKKRAPRAEYCIVGIPHNTTI